MMNGNKPFDIFGGAFGSSGVTANVNADTLIATPIDNLINGFNFTANISPTQVFVISSSGGNMTVKAQSATLQLQGNFMQLFTNTSIILNNTSIFVSSTLFDASGFIHADILNTLSPASSDPGQDGEIRADATYLYVYSSAFTGWGRVSLISLLAFGY